MEWNRISVAEPIKIYIVVLQNGGETHRISGRIRGSFLDRVVFIYTELPERPGVFGCVYRGEWGVVVDRMGCWGKSGSSTSSGS